MFAIRLEDTIDNHDLVIPFEKLKMLNHQNVEVIILPKLHQVAKSKVTLSSILTKYKDTKPFADIKDSVEWQRESRNEW